MNEALPTYLQIAHQLRQNLQSGTYQAGEQIPTEAQLAQRFNVNRHTLRRAIGLLKEEGLLRVDQGRGTFVANPLIRYPIGQRVRYNETLKAHGHTASFKLIRAVAIPAEAAIAKELEISLGSEVALIERLDFADNQPISISSSYFPMAEFPDILEHAQAMQSISKVLREIYGCEHIRRTTRVSARMVKLTDARLLELPLNCPILLAESVNVDQHHRVIQYGVTRFRGDRMELEFHNTLL
ncbi:MAG: phosphonate metabolism transcriptional regulator PhnF [Leptolyngbyaceae bacterium]|nr:phosphonate metabolism transcriptional regulator PhnF [Leptolyngbyaceae bacterium]